MKTVFIGAGQGCLAVFELYDLGRLKVLDLEVLGVVDPNPEAPGLVFARERGWPAIPSIEEAMGLDGLEMVIELTGDDEVLESVYWFLPPGVRIMDHITTRVFWDLEEVTRALTDQLKEKTDLQNKLKADREELQTIMDAIPDQIMVLDNKMGILSTNRRYEEVRGLTRQQVHGKRCVDECCLVDPRAECNANNCAFTKVMESKQPVTMVKTCDRALESNGHFQITANPILDKEGEVGSVVLTSREITDQVLLKRDTEESERRFREIINAVHGIIAVKDLDGRYQLVNPRAERAFGMRAEDMIGRRANELFPPDVALTIEEGDRRALEINGHFTCEQILKLDGAPRMLVSERFPLHDYDGNVIGVCWVARDDTRSRQLHNELVQAERLVAVGSLAADVAHELNNPLTGILALAEDLLLEAQPENPAREDYQVILNEALRCRRIVRNLLDFSRQKALERQPLEINEIVNRVLALVERQASFHNVHVGVELGHDLPLVNIDGGQIEQALFNLLINARDAVGASGSVDVRTSIDDDDQHIAVTITDDGCGISEELIDKVFTPFFTTKGSEGTGLGLPMVKRVAEQHGGDLEVETTLGSGTQFRLLLPINQTERRGE